MNIVWPKESLTPVFSNYKEKVLFILKKMITNFGNNIILSHPNNDLQWCYFVIENDYLQISNSISVNKDFENLYSFTNGQTEPSVSK